MNNNEIAELKYEYYKSGKSLKEVGLKFNCSRQSIWELFKNRNWKMRTINKKEFVEFNSFKYTKRKDGYFRKTKEMRELKYAQKSI